MSYVLPYILSRFLANITEFLNKWYVRSFLNMTEYMFGLFEEMDKAFALKINLRNLFKPLYQDRNIISYILGFFFRGSRSLLAIIVYAAVFGITVALYLAWLSVPIFFIYKSISGI